MFGAPLYRHPEFLGIEANWAPSRFTQGALFPSATSFSPAFPVLGSALGLPPWRLL